MATPRQTLTVQLAHANIQVSNLSAQLEDALLCISELRVQLTQPAVVPTATPARVAYLARMAAPQDKHNAYRAACAAAREAAIASGKAVRVSH